MFQLTSYEFKDKAKSVRIHILNRIILKVDNGSICKVNDDGDKHNQRHKHSP